MNFWIGGTQPIHQQQHSLLAPAKQLAGLSKVWLRNNLTITCFEAIYRATACQDMMTQRWQKMMTWCQNMLLFWILLPNTNETIGVSECLAIIRYLLHLLNGSISLPANETMKYSDTVKLCYKRLLAGCISAFFVFCRRLNIYYIHTLCITYILTRCTCTTVYQCFFFSRNIG